MFKMNKFAKLRVSARQLGLDALAKLKAKQEAEKEKALNAREEFKAKRRVLLSKEAQADQE